MLSHLQTNSVDSTNKTISNIHLECCNITDEQVLPLCEALRENNSSLLELNLFGNNIGDVGCLALVALLENPKCNLYTLECSNNNISSMGAITMANSLSKNTKLFRLCLNNNQIPSPNPHLEAALNRVLCNTSSIKATYSSNHTIASFTWNWGTQYLGNQLTEVLKLNKGFNKSHVAIKKILKYHRIDMEPLYDWDEDGEWTLKALPYVVSWFEKAERAAPKISYDDFEEVEYEEELEYYDVDERKVSAIYQFAKAMPLMFKGIVALDIMDVE